MKKIINLKNGIKLISHKLNNTHSATISINFRTGSLYENEYNNGITHLVEHLFFRKWDDLIQKDFYSEMMSLGAEIIGNTYNDYVSFSITVVPDYFMKAFELISKCLNVFYWDDDCVVDEKRVVCKQIENKFESYREWLNSCYFNGVAYELPIMGTAKTVRHLSVDDINKWKGTYFCCNNSCVVITGKYTDRDFEIAKKKLSEINNIGRSADMIICTPQNFNNRNADNRYSLISNNSENTDVTIFFDINSKYDFEAVRLLSAILGEGCGSVLSMKLRETLGYTDDIYTDLVSFCGFNRLSVSFSVSNSDFYGCMESFFKIMSDFKNCITQDDYLRNIGFFTNNQIIDLDNPNVLNKRYALCDFVLESFLSDPLKLKEKYETISISLLEMCAKEILTDNNISFLIQTAMKDENIKKHLEKLINTVL